jgi:hypothetical protein
LTADEFTNLKREPSNKDILSRKELLRMLMLLTTSEESPTWISEVRAFLPDVQAHKKEISSWTDKFVRDEKNKNLPEPNYQLRFAIGIPSYKEASAKEGPPTFLSALHSIALASLENCPSMEGFSPAQVEVLFNVNNSENPTEDALLENRLQLQIIELFQRPIRDYNVIEEEINRLYKESGLTSVELPSFITNVLPTIYQALHKGLSVVGIDSTDGMYISRFTSHDSTIEPQDNQGSRSRLINLIASNRFDKVNQTNGFQMRMGADTRVPKDFFSSLREEDLVQGVVVKRAKRFVEPTSYIDFGDVRASADNLNMLSFDVSAIFENIARRPPYIFQFARIKAALGQIFSTPYSDSMNAVNHGGGTAGTNSDMLLSELVVRRVGGYAPHNTGIGGFGEDAMLLERIVSIDPTLVMLESDPILISARVRKESFMGRSALDDAGIDARLAFAVYRLHQEKLGRKGEDEVLYSADKIVYVLRDLIIETLATESPAKIIELFGKNDKTVTVAELMQRIAYFAGYVFEHPLRYKESYRLFLELGKKLQKIKKVSNGPIYSR